MPHLLAHRLFLFTALALVALTACGEDEADNTRAVSTLETRLDQGGGELRGLEGTLFEGFVVTFPAASLRGETRIVVRETLDEPALPQGAASVGTQFRLEADPPDALQGQFQIRLPFDQGKVQEAQADLTAVKVWVRDPEQGWVLHEPISADERALTLSLDSFTALGAGLAP